jgi:hypothetical protein
VTAATSGAVLPALPNLRQVAGMTGAGGRVVRPGVLWRSDDPALLEAHEAEAVLGLGVRTVLDLRDEDLVRRRPRHALVEAGATRVALPVLGWAPGDALEGSAPPRDLDLLVEYAAYLEHGADAFAEAVRVVARSDEAVLVHCAAGKDRTGTLVAVVLRLVGVDDDAIVADYAETERRMPAMLARWRRLNPQLDAALATMPAALLEARPATMRAFLAGLDERWGGAEGWARRAGLTDHDRAALRDRLLGPS